MANYQIIFDVRGLENSTYNKIEGLKDIMESELVRVYNIYAKKNK